MTAAETAVRVEELERQRLGDAWVFAMLQRQKELPRRPSDLWKSEEDDAAGDDMLVAAAQGRFALQNLTTSAPAEE